MGDNKISSIARKIYFYKAICYCDDKEVSLNYIFEEYIKQFKNDYKDLEKRNLAIPYYDKYHFLDIEKHNTDANVYRGRFYSLRMSDFPYLFNMSDGSRQEISSNDSDTLMEQTHFCCFANKRLIVSEYNFFGARIEQLATYLKKIMFFLFPSKKTEISINPIVIPEYFKKILNCTAISKFQFKVAAPGLKLLKECGIISAIDVVKNNVTPESEFYLDIEISGGKRKSIEFSNISEILKGIVNAIKKGNEIDKSKPDGANDTFRKAKVRAYSPEEGKNLPYDLLDEKLVHNCYVEKLSNKTKYVNSEKMFQRIMEAYNSKVDEALRYMEKIDE